MNKFILLAFLISSLNLSAEQPLQTEPLKEDKLNEQVVPEVKSKPQAFAKTISFNYNNEDLTKVINDLAGIKRVNILFPQPPAKINAKVTFNNKDDISVDKAWNLVTTMLDLAGYTVFKEKNFYKISKNDNATREALPVFVNEISKLPNSDEKIRYIYFFDHISINDPSTPNFANLEQILRDVLPTEQEGSTFILDGNTNSLIIVSKASAIRSVMSIIKELDTSGFPETIEVIPLVHTRSDFISKLLNQLIPGNQEPQFRYGPFPAKSTKIGGYYFSEQTKILSIDRTNSIAILGPLDSVQRIKDFITTYLDLPIESEKSVIHVKALQYLDADALAPILQDLVKARAASAQAEGVATERDTLANAIIVAEKLVQAPTITPTVPAAQGAANPAPTSTAPLIGGNRVIVAARAHDWNVINRLIDELDQPQLQVGLEVLVTDLSIDDNNLIGSHLRNNIDCGDLSNVNFQSAQLQTKLNGGIGSSPGPVLNYENESDPTQGFTDQGLASDLLRLTKNAPYSNGSTPVNIATLAAPGSTIFSVANGNGINYVLQLLNNYSSTTILSQPFVVTKNNQQANISIAKEQYYQMGVENQSTGGPVIRRRQPVRADLTVNILPRISKANDINLEILVNVNDFTTPADNPNYNITTRQVRTNTNLKNKEVLVIGGLARTDTADVVTETPVLSKIPILGYFFKRKSQVITKRNLTIFISPTIIKPRLQGGMDLFTRNKINLIKGEVEEAEIAVLGSNFEKLRDPITRVYFVPLGKQINAAIDYYAEQKAYVAGSEAVEVAKEISLVGGSPEHIGVSSQFDLHNAEEIKKKARDHENPLNKIS